jgi:hypothetical protein
MNMFCMREFEYVISMDSMMSNPHPMAFGFIDVAFPAPSSAFTMVTSPEIAISEMSAEEERIKSLLALKLRLFGATLNCPLWLMACANTEVVSEGVG